MTTNPSGPQLTTSVMINLMLLWDTYIKLASASRGVIRSFRITVQQAVSSRNIIIDGVGLKKRALVCLNVETRRDGQPMEEEELTDPTNQITEHVPVG